jgi:hypothetical protein
MNLIFAAGFSFEPITVLSSAGREKGLIFRGMGGIFTQILQILVAASVRKISNC